MLNGLGSPVEFQTNSTGLSVDWPAAVGPVVTVAATVAVDAAVGEVVGAGMVVERIGAVPPHAESRQMTSDWRKSFFAFISDEALSICSFGLSVNEVTRIVAQRG